MQSPRTSGPFVYIVRCAGGTLYTGWSIDVDKRVASHNAGRGGGYTRAHRPVVLVYQEEVPDRRAAMRREVTVKRYSRERKERLIAGKPATKAKRIEK